MKYSILCLVLMLISFELLGQDTDPKEKFIDDLIENHGVVGVVAAYSISGQDAWTKAKGFSNREQKIPFSVNTVSRIASIAKPMTAVAVMQLVEQELLDLHQPIQNYIPDLKKSKIGMVTTHQLLSHTSGLGAYKNNKERQNRKHFPNMKAAVGVFKNRKLKFKSGSKYGYTSYGYVVLGLVIEAVSGLSFEEYMTKNIWEAADMTQTGVEHFGERYPGMTEFYHYEKGRAIISEQNDLSNRVPGGGFYTTASDLIKFGNAILDNRLISEVSLHQMVEIHSLDKKPNKYGYGWFLYGPHPQENAVIGHSGEQTGVAAQFFIHRLRKEVVVIISNTSLRWEQVFGSTVYLMNSTKEEVVNERF